MVRHTQADRQGTAGRLLRALVRLRHRHPDMTVLQAMCLFYVAENPGVTQRQLYEALDTSDSAASRILAILSHYGARGAPPLGLVQIDTNPDDRRERLLRLTEAGQKLLDEVISDLSPSPRKTS